MFGRTLLTVTSLVLSASGLGALFAPAELAGLLVSSAAPPLALVIQLTASGLLGFAILNWMSRRNRIGGIYGRPLGLANLLLFAIAALSLGKAIAAGTLSPAAWPACLLLALFAASFAWLVFVHDPLGGEVRNGSR
ncbi:hypothetical protein E2493_06065 [Sphingomonas parva]|uniref:Uncharacterized protein n=1 Tax=Sphingomonas parva TaxID=2555898 RepID=A0A4Y8ZWK7_9SPHN|nr:hypothetical protein [Sphingomonas parva]TFI59089.1 hypothetical protein E2493_06065 [Sphingomonas parva]